MGQEDEAEKRRRPSLVIKVSGSAFTCAPDCMVRHCLPARGEITDEVLKPTLMKYLTKQKTAFTPKAVSNTDEQLSVCITNVLNNLV